jgi:hypothetical protein
MTGESGGVLSVPNTLIAVSSEPRSRSEAGATSC